MFYYVEASHDTSHKYFKYFIFLGFFFEKAKATC